MPAVADRVIRLAVDINVFVADAISRNLGRRGGAARQVVDAIRNGSSPASPVQFVISVPIIENYANVLARRLGYSREDADAKAWLLHDYSVAGPLPESPLIVVGSGYIPFETEQQLRASLAAMGPPGEAKKLFDGIADDRYVLETALAGKADILATSDVDDFARGPAVRFTRSDVLVFPFGGRRLVIATPAFLAHWLQQGIVPDAAFVAARPADFVAQPERWAR